ncbi:MAG TPA: ABC transporter permease [Terriglobia bacterium]|nr:ABC transporter permease [Terriglobia bacterium]
MDFRYGVRTLAKSPGFTSLAVLTLALGIGANTSIFSVVNAVLLRPLPFRDSGRLMVLSETNERQPHVSVSYPNYFDWRQQNHVFEDMASFQPRDFNLAGVSEPENIGGAAVSSSLLRTLGIKPLLGRDFIPEEDKKGAEPVVMLSHGLWQRRFGGEASAVGKTLTLDGKPFTIIGVLPPQFMLYEEAQVYTPIGVWMDADMMERGAHNDTSVVARLKPGVALPQAQADMDTIARQLEQQYPTTNKGYRVEMISLRDKFVGDSGPPILVLFAAVGLVLLIACVNVANLLLARGTARSREIAIRSALGASRVRVVRQLLTEGLTLALMSGAFGLLLGAWGIAGLVALIPESFIMGPPIVVDRRVLAFTAALSLFTVIISCLVPALQASKPDLNETLKESGRTSSGGIHRLQLRNLLAVSEIALALLLLIGAGLMMKSFARLLAVDPGFNPESVLTMSLSLRGPQYEKPEQITAFCQQALQRVRALPDVRYSALGTELPLTDNHSRNDITIEGQPIPEIDKFPHPDFHVVSPDYFKAMGIPLMRGRDFTEADNPQSPGVVLISQSLARRFWPMGDAVGKTILIGHPASKNPSLTIVGIVGDTKQYGLAAATPWEVYLSYLQHPTGNFRVVVRTVANPENLTAIVKSEIRAVDRDVPFSEVETMRNLVSDSVGSQRMTMLLLGLFAALAMVLAAVGIYGVISYSVGQRTHEIGIRMALGAERRDVLWFVMDRGFTLTAFGVSTGLVGALALTRFLSSLLYGVSATDSFIFGGVSMLLTVVALLASYIPARRATKVDPMVALRYE